MERESIGGPLIVGALLLAVSILGAAYFLSRAIDRGTDKLHELTVALQELPGAAPAPSPAERAAARPARPDPNRRYQIDVAGAPSKGPEDAVITIVEWSDFQ